MKEKKHIDRLFQEKFKDFEVNPPDFVWENIETELQKKKKRRVIPIWFRLSGVAALLLIGLLLLNPFEEEQQLRQENNPVVKSSDDNGNDNSNNINPATNATENSVTNENDGLVNSETTEGITGTNNTGSVTQESYPSTNSSKGNSSPKINNFSNTKSAVASQGGSNNANNTSAATNADAANPKIIKNTATGVTTDTQSAVAINSGTENSNANQNKNNGTVTVNNPSAINNTTEQAVAESDNGTTTQGTDIVVNENPAGNIIINKEIAIEEAVAETEIDSASAEEPENELEKLLQERLNEKDKNKLAQAEVNTKWNVRPQVAPVFYNSLSQGSPIDAQFAGNSKDYNNNLSYGVGVNYALNDKISIRSGVNTVNLSYSTRGVEFYPSMSGQTNNVSSKRPESATANFIVHSANAANASPNEAASSQTFSGSLLQEMGYIEVPVEMSYALLNKKFGIEVIGGFSTLFLNDNQVSVVTDQGYSSPLGQAENLNNIHFSTNVGLGFRYRFTKALQASFEPTFKYQLNAFSSDAGNFKPYFIGLYSGISFSF
ncbi:hypothetical protein [Flavobacterium coralii]|uniref:hypothetical protein n=1 Tax=Flavobacterium coralii TaxID=2838017 RepID=UPI000C3A91D6|nr:hypothetical protein [Flavobacterium sp.]|tara:strand:+ start:6701 stop:8344 length:1644 start_codon:yes stop_codon:yes gene_type:complete